MILLLFSLCVRVSNDNYASYQFSLLIIFPDIKVIIFYSRQYVKIIFTHHYPTLQTFRYDKLEKYTVCIANAPRKHKIRYNTLVALCVAYY